jgi:hypothetical protein
VATRYERSCPRLDGRASTEGRGSKSSPQWARAEAQVLVKRGGACSSVCKKTKAWCRGSRGRRGRRCARLWRVRLLLTGGLAPPHGRLRSSRRAVLPRTAPCVLHLLSTLDVTGGRDREQTPSWLGFGVRRPRQLL